MAAARAVVRAFEQLGTLKAALIVGVGRDPEGGTGLGSGRLIDPENPRGPGGRAFGAAGPPALVVHDPAAVRVLDALPVGKTEATATLRLGPPVEREVKLRNVVGLLRGSDPTLRDTYVLVTAHYDHVGVQTPVKGDKIYNGANDDGSGTVSVIELASALATLKERPRRSIVFATFFGEEHGLLGSRYYARQPAVPIEKTVADVNLEQLGRTDDNEGPRVAGASMTGIDYSDVGAIFRAAGEADGIKVDRHPRNSDAFFGASDNQALADLGVPAHTICVAYLFPDYHSPGDHWDKVDFPNMARVDRMVARALITIADDPEPPRWDPANPKAKRYRDAYEKRHSR
jgi:Zn-dependent M28 family amino/carboxypeptidase